MHGRPPCSTTQRSSMKAYYIWPGPIQADGTKFSCAIPGISTAQIFAICNFFQLSNTPSIKPSFLTFRLSKLALVTARRSLCPIRSTYTTIHKCFMLSLLPASPSPNPDFWRRKLGKVLDLRTCSDQPPPMAPRSYRPMVCRTRVARDAQCDG